MLWITVMHSMAVWQRGGSHTWKLTGQQSRLFLAEVRLPLQGTVSSVIARELFIQGHLFSFLELDQGFWVCACFHYLKKQYSLKLACLSETQMTAGLTQSLVGLQVFWFTPFDLKLQACSKAGKVSHQFWVFAECEGAWYDFISKIQIRLHFKNSPLKLKLQLETTADVAFHEAITSSENVSSGWDRALPLDISTFWCARTLDPSFTDPDCAFVWAKENSALAPKFLICMRLVNAATKTTTTSSPADGGSGLSSLKHGWAYPKEAQGN